MNELLLILQFILAAVITVVILLQKSSSIGLGVYSGSNESLFGAKGPASFLAKTTFVLGVIFVANTLALGYVYTQKSQKSVLDSINTESMIPSIPQTHEQNNTQSLNTSDTNTTPPIDAPSTTQHSTQGENNASQ